MKMRWQAQTSSGSGWMSGSKKKSQKTRREKEQGSQGEPGEGEVGVTAEILFSMVNICISNNSVVIYTRRQR